MAVFKIAENIYSVGIVDKEVRIFHGYETPHGSTYNSYLVIDEKISLIDNVKGKFTDEFIANISEIVPLDKIDYIITNHIEPDHSGSIEKVMELAGNATVVATAAAIRGLGGYYKLDNSRMQAVKAGDTLCTGKYNFHFVPMPMVHWPDSMCTYLAEEKMLFSNDAFGEHYGSDFHFDDEVDADFLAESMENYYGNIVLPFGMQVLKIIEAASKLDIKMILPSHGLILRSDLGKYIAKYVEYANNVCDEKKAVIVYDTMWGATELMADELKKEWEADGLNVEVIKLSDVHYSIAMGKITQAKYIAVGSSTLNRQMMPTVAAFLCYMKGLSPKGRTGLAFGSYGWSGESIALVQKELEACGMEILPARKTTWKNGLI
ncbi:MAG: FprA family A-type flavoprotein [Bacillota bacterium]